MRKPDTLFIWGRFKCETIRHFTRQTLEVIGCNFQTKNFFDTKCLFIFKPRNTKVKAAEEMLRPCHKSYLLWYKRLAKMFSNKIHSVWYYCYQYTETRNSSFCVTILYGYIFESLRYRKKGLKNENNIFAQYYRRKRLFEKETTMFWKNSSHGSHRHLLNWLYAKEVMSRSFYNHGLSINPKQ